MSTGPRTRTLTRAHAHSHVHTHTHARTLTLTHAHSHAHSHTQPIHSHTLTHTHTDSHTLTLTHTHARTLTHAHSHSLTRTPTHTCTRPGKPGPGASVRQSETPSRPHVVNNLRMAQGCSRVPWGPRPTPGPACRWVSFLASASPARRVTVAVPDAGPVPSAELSRVSEEGGAGRGGCVPGTVCGGGPGMGPGVHWKVGFSLTPTPRPWPGRTPGLLR